MLVLKVCIPFYINSKNSNNNIIRISISALAMSKIDKRHIVAGRMRRLFEGGTYYYLLLLYYYLLLLIRGRHLNATLSRGGDAVSSKYGRLD